MDRIDPSKSITSWRSAWRSALRCTGLRLRFRDLRHTAITNLSESPEVSEQTIMSITRTSGYNEVSCLGRYRTTHF